MRTTLTLEEDLASALADLSRRTGKSFKAVVNDTLRQGLGGSGGSEPPFVVVPHHGGGMRSGIDERRLNELAWDPELDLAR